MSDPDQIRADIERTRSRLDTDVDALADKVSPEQIAERQKEKVRGHVTDVRESIMGGVRSAKDAASSAGDAARPGDRAAQATKGHPLVVGLLAFGAGWLVSSLLPSTDAEQRAVGRAKEQAAPLTEKVKETAKQAGQEVAADLKEPAQQAAEHVKGTAQDAAGTVQQEGRSAAGDVRDQAQQSKDAVQGRASDARDRVQDASRS